LLLLSVWAGSSDATIRHVRDDYPSIQLAILASGDGDTVLVEPDTYGEAIDFLGKSILVASWYVLEGDTSLIRQTVIDAGMVIAASVVRFASEESRASRLAGFTIKGGSAQLGGGIYCHQTSPTLDHLRVVHNTATGDGGGIYALYGFPLVSACTIAYNQAVTGDGGGIWAQLSDIEIRNNYIHHNHALFRGAGVFCEHSWPTITGNTVTDNVIDTLPPGYCYGGGIVSRNCDPVITANYVAHNDGGGYGGGIFY
jgi:predicted outer membrane repeat protein